MAILIADSGSTKCEWCLAGARTQHSYFTQGMSPYFLDQAQMEQVIRQELLTNLRNKTPEAIFFYGTGCKDKENAKKVSRALRAVFKTAEIRVDHDLAGAAKALCGDERGVACILGTGSNSCYYNGKRIVANSPGLGYVLGDEGSGAYLGKKVVQYFLYNIFEEPLKNKFKAAYRIDADGILESVYRKPLPNRYLASFAGFLSENRGHYMIENIIEDGLNDFFYNHVSRYGESRKYPVHFTGGVAYAFRDVVTSLCDSYEMTAGSILKNPMEGLLRYHRR